MIGRAADPALARRHRLSGLSRGAAYGAALLALVVAYEAGAADLAQSRAEPFVTLIRREGFAEYEQFIAAFRSRLRAETRVLAVRPETSRALVAYLKATRPVLVVAVGATAYRSVGRSGVGPLLAVYVSDGALPAGESVAAPIGPRAVLATLAALRPEARRIGLVCGERPRPAAFERALAREVRRRQLQILRMSSRSGGEAVRLLRREAAHLDAIWLLPGSDSLTGPLVRYAVALQLHRRIPLVGVTRQQVRAGALFALAHSPEQLADAAAEEARALLAAHPPSREARARLGSAGASSRGSSAGEPRLAINALTAAHLGIDLSAWAARAEIITP
ncbi:MAG: hypothetical protein IPL40_11275 [Proteobacteria bacterium]|nr:hypothetical protein [Pseudomonadota bacterium]